MSRSTNPKDHARIANYYASAFKPRVVKKHVQHSTSQGTPRKQWPNGPTVHHDNKPAAFKTVDRPAGYVSAKAGNMWKPRNDVVSGVRIFKGAAAQAFLDEQQ